MEKKWEKHPGGRPPKDLKQIAKEPANGVYYTVGEAAELLGVHTLTIQRRLKAGTLAGKKISGFWRIYKEELYQGKGANE